MKDNVKRAIKNIEIDLMYGNPEKLEAVSRADVETLLEYALKRLKKVENRPTELKVGDKVKVLTDLPGIGVRAGTTGSIYGYRDGESHQHSIGVQFRDRVNILFFSRDELEKIN